jgi:hypothetical protein
MQEVQILHSLDWSQIWQKQSETKNKNKNNDDVCCTIWRNTSSLCVTQSTPNQNSKIIAWIHMYIFGRLTVVQHIVYGPEEKLCHSYVSKGSSSMQRIEQIDMLWSLLFNLLFVSYNFSFGHFFVCSSSIYGFWLPLWYLQTFLSKYLLS